MSFLQRYTPTNKQASVYSLWHIRLDGRWLVLARILWMLFVASILSIFVVGIFSFYSRHGNLEAAISGDPAHLDSSINGYTRFSLQLLYIMGGPTTLNIVLAAISSFVWITVGMVVFWRSWGKPEKWGAMFVSLTLVLFGVNFSPFLSLMYVHTGIYSPWRLLITLVQVLAYIFMGLFFCLFPDGRFVPRRAYWFALLNTAYQGFFIAPTSASLSVNHWPPLVFAFVEVSFILAFMFAQFYRFRLVSGSIARQQTKWVVYGMAMVMAAYTALVLLTFLFPPLSQPGPSFLSQSISVVLMPFVTFPIPLTIGIAMLRYRLWDIDILINRTLIYGTLSVVLALIYFGCVVLLQQLFQAITGQGSTLAIVGSTLIIVVLCRPLQRRIQTMLDRHFYRRKYDANKIIAAFSVRLQSRSELDLSTLTGDIQAVVQETMQPTHVSLWVCQRATDATKVQNRENERFSN